MTEIFVSSSGIGGTRIGEVARKLADLGFDRIELSGGTEWYSGWRDDLAALRAERGVQFLCHNYFPPPRRPLVVNLASLDPETHERSLEVLADGVRHSAELGGRRFGLHAGFLLDFSCAELGNQLGRRPLFPREAAAAAFWRGFERLERAAAGQGIGLYVENNVYSARNREVYGLPPPFFMTCHADIEEFTSGRRAGLLLDLAHLRVSCRTLGLDFAGEFARLAPRSDYWHMSENDGREDTNEAIGPDSRILAAIAAHPFRPAVLTIEVRGERNLRDSYERLRETLEGKPRVGARGQS